MAVLLQNNVVYAMGPGPGACANMPGTDDGPEYHSEIISLIVDNGVERYDVLANPGMTIPVQKYGSYTVDIVFHTDQYGYRFKLDGSGEKVYETSSDRIGYLWYYSTANGFGSQSECVGPVKGDQDIAISRTYGMSYYGDREGPHYVEFDTDISDPPEAEYYVHLVDELPGSSGPITNELTVNTQDRNGNAIYGYYTVLYDDKDGSVVDTGFSPATFTLVSGKAYIIQVQDYGNYVFDYWEDEGSFSERDRYISITSDISITAVYRNANEPSPQPEPQPEPAPSGGQSSLTIRTEDMYGNEITGYYTVLMQNGAVIETGFSPKTFTLDTDEDYTVSVSDYGSYAFDHWAGSGSEIREMNVEFVNDGSDTLTAVYRNVNEQVEPEPSPEPSPPPEQITDTISVTTVDSSGNQIYGYYTTLWQDGNVIQSAFSPAGFTVSTGQTYQVAVADYGQYVFDHWSDGSYDRFHNAQAGDELVAVYRTN